MDKKQKQKVVVVGGIAITAGLILLLYYSTLAKAKNLWCDKEGKYIPENEYTIVRCKEQLIPVQSVLTSVQINPLNLAVNSGDSSNLTAVARDQYGFDISNRVSFLWRTSPDLGTLSTTSGNTTILTAGTPKTGVVQVRANDTVNSVFGSCSVVIA